MGKPGKPSFSWFSDLADVSMTPKTNITYPPPCPGHQWSLSNAVEVCLVGKAAPARKSPSHCPHGSGGSLYRLAALFLHICFVPLSNTLLETILAHLDATLANYGYHFASISDPPGNQDEAQNASPSSTGQNPEFADGCTNLMIPKASQKNPTWRQHPFQIDDFCRMHS